MQNLKLHLLQNYKLIKIKTQISLDMKENAQLKNISNLIQLSNKL